MQLVAHIQLFHLTPPHRYVPPWPILFNDLVLLFYGRDANDEGGQQDPAEFIEDFTFAINGQVYADEIRKQTATRVIFRHTFTR